MYNQIAVNKRKSILLILVFIGLLLGLGYVGGMYSPWGSYGGLSFALIVSLISTSVSYFAGDRIALFTSGARPVHREQNPYLYRMVENLCIANGLPLPKIYIIEDSALNAFATGRDPRHASVAVTRGLLDGLKNEELEGVVAHELSHIKNYDIRFMTLVMVLVGALLLLRDMIWRSMLFSGSGSSRANRQEGGTRVFLVVGLALTILAPFIAQLIKLAISRRREYLADASGALLTRYPEGLASALEKIGAYKAPMLRANEGTAHLFIASPFSARVHKGLTAFFSTHPPLEERIRILREMTV